MPTTAMPAMGATGNSGAAPRLTTASRATLHSANPCVAPIERSPFYAVRIMPGSLGTFAGLRTDAQARVLDRDGRAIAGLYACGNDMASMMGGRYPSGGITLGPAMTFGYIAAHHAAGAAADLPGD